MEQHRNSPTTDAMIDAALEESLQHDHDPAILEASFDGKQQLLFLKLSDGRRLFIPREDLPELHGASEHQARDLFIGPHGLFVWWPQIDDGLYLADFLEHRWHRPAPAAHRAAA